MSNPFGEELRMYMRSICKKASVETTHLRFSCLAAQPGPVKIMATLREPQCKKTAAPSPPP